MKSPLITSPQPPRRPVTSASSLQDADEHDPHDDEEPAEPLSPTGPAANLIGTWSADVTQAALDRAGITPNEFGEVGATRLVFDEAGQVEVILGDGAEIPATAVVDGGTLDLVPIPESLQDGRGEHWRYRWSVFNDTLTLERLTGPGIDPGPTSLVSQPFGKE